MRVKTTKETTTFGSRHSAARLKRGDHISNSLGTVNNAGCNHSLSKQEMRSQPSELFGGEAPTSDADDPIPQKKQPRSGFVAAVGMVETNAPHDQSQKAKYRQEIVVTFCAEESGVYLLFNSDIQLDPNLGQCRRLRFQHTGQQLTQAIRLAEIP